MAENRGKRAVIISNIKSQSIEQAIFILKTPDLGTHTTAEFGKRYHCRGTGHHQLIHQICRRTRTCRQTQVLVTAYNRHFGNRCRMCGGGFSVFILYLILILKKFIKILFLLPASTEKLP